MNNTHEQGVKISKPTKRGRGRMSRRRATLAVLVGLLTVCALIGAALYVPINDGKPLISFDNRDKEINPEEQLFDEDAQDLYESDAAWRKQLEKTPLPAGASPEETAEYNESMIAANVSDNPQESIRLYESMVKSGIDPTITSSVQVADAYIAMGNKDGARSAYKRAKQTIRTTYTSSDDVTREERLADIDELSKEAGL